MISLFTTVVEISLGTSALIAVLLLLSPLLLRRYAAKGLTVVWLLITLRLLIPVSIHANQAPIHIAVPVGITAAPAAASHAGNGQATAASAAPENDARPDPAPAARLTPAGILTIVWSAGVVIFAVERSAGYFLLRRSIRRLSKPVKDTKALAAFRAVQKDMRLAHNRVRLLEYPKTQSPMLTGLLRPVILLPAVSFEAEELELILRHELLHYKRRDIWFKLLLTCAGSLHWFNPFVCLMLREAGRQIENACDEEIVKGKDLSLRKKYSESILSAMTGDRARRLGMTTYFHGGKKMMKERFTNIFSTVIKKRGVAMISAVLISLLAVSTLVACSPKTDASASPSASPSVSPSSSANVTAGTPDTSTPAPTPTEAAPKFSDLVSLIGKTKEELLAAISEEPTKADEGGLAFDKTGIRVWFDTNTYTKVAQVLILTDTIDIDGLKLGDDYKDFNAKLGDPISDKNGDAHFKYGDVYLSVLRDTSTDKVISVYILAQDF